MSLKKRFSSLLIPTLVIAVLVHEIWTTPVYGDRELAAMREAAVAQARQGDVETALAKLRALAEVAPRDRAVWGDYLTELVRARRDDEALTLYRGSSERSLPDYALAELFDAAVRKQDFELARAIADREIAQSAERDSVATARQRVLDAVKVSQESIVQESSRSGAIADAAVIDAEKQNSSTPVNIERATAGAARSVRSRSDRNKVRAENTASAQQQREFDTTNPSSQPHEETVSLEEVARNAVRAAENAPAAERVTKAEAALPAVEAYETSLPSDSNELRNAKLDRMRALTLANRVDEAAALFESLGAPEQLPLYGVLNGADLYARRHEPERARVLLDIAAKQQPDSHELLVAQYYNQLDLDQYDRAAQTLAQLRESSRDEASQRDAEIMSAMFAAYQNHLAQAQLQLERMQRTEPDNPDIQLRLAQIYRWRGWSRRALAEYRAATARASDPISAQVGEIAALNDMHAFRQSREQLQRLAEMAPAHPEVVEAQKQQQLRERWDYSAQVLTGHSSGGPVTTGGDIAFDQKLYAPPIDDQYRAYVHQRYDWADFPEGSGNADRLGVGADYRSPTADVAAEISDRIPGGHIGVTLNGEWKFDERLSAFGEIQTDSTQVPLRALHAGIDGHSQTAGVLYRADESHAARASYSRADFDDSNRRNTVSAEYQQSVYQDARNQLSAVVQGYYSDNSAGSDVPYFNPDSESSLGVAAIYEGTLWRRYERRWSQRLQVGLSNYEQQHFGSGGIWDVQYEQRWQLSDALSFSYGALYRSRIYDGDREGYAALLGGVNWRF